MNRDYIYRIVEPYLNEERYLKEKDFDDIFDSLNMKEKYKVVEVLIELNIDIVYMDSEVNSDGEEDNQVKTIMSENTIKQLVNNVYSDVNAIKNKAGKFNNLSNEQLVILFQQGNKMALEILYSKNHRLVASRVNRCVNKYRHKLDFEDLVNFGFFGLLKAAEKFDRQKGYKFTTYSIWWIDQHIFRAIADYGFTIRVPVHIFEDINYINRVQVQNIFETERELVDYVTKIKGYPEEKVRELLVIMNNIYNPSSLHTLVGEDMETELIEFIPSPSDETTESLVDAIIVREEIEKKLNTLTQREAKILRLRYGLNDGRYKTLKEVGTHFNISRERIRQIEAKAIGKLRRGSAAIELKELI